MNTDKKVCLEMAQRYRDEASRALITYGALVVIFGVKDSTTESAHKSYQTAAREADMYERLANAHPSTRKAALRVLEGRAA